MLVSSKLIHEAPSGILNVIAALEHSENLRGAAPGNPGGAR
jgi:hypothetical protein